MNLSPFFALSQDLLSVIRTDGAIVALSPAWEKTLGWSLAELTATDSLDLLHPDDRGDAGELLRRLVAGQSPQRFEVRCRRKDGRYLWLSGQSALSAEDGRIYSVSRDVTESKRAALHLLAVESHSRVGTWDLDLETGLLNWSPMTHRIHATDPATHRPYLEEAGRFFPGEALPALLGAIADLHEGGGPVRLELPFLTADGRARWVLFSAAAEAHADRPRRIYGTLEDITEKRQERLHLLAFKDIVERSTDGIWVVGPDGRTQYANGRMAAIMGCTEEALLPARFLDHVLAEPRPRVADLMAGTVRVERDWSDFQMWRMDGSPFWASASIHPRQAPDGTLHSTVVLVRDISAWRRVELEREVNRARLELSQNIARLGYWELDLRSGSVFWSDVVYDIFGVPKDREAHSQPAFMAAVHPDDRARVLETQQRVEAIGFADVEHRVVRPDGEVRWVHEVAKLDRDADGHPLRIIGTVQDITPQKEVQARLDQAVAQAEAANRAKTQFLATMSHELRTPLNAILGFSEIIRDGTFGQVSPGIYHEYAGHVHDSASHLLDIINDVLDLAKVESATVTLTPEPVPLDETVRRAVQTVRPIARDRRVSFAVDGAQAVTVLADRRALLQSLYNILSNALRHSPENGTVEVRLELTDGFGALTIRDYGPGFPPEVLAELGQPYPGRRNVYVSAARSTGLGYAITAALLGAMGGVIDACNAPDGGACVTFRLPLAPAPGATASAPVPVTAPAPTA